VQPLSPELADSLGARDARGAVVARVYPDGPAAGTELAKNDVIVGFEGTSVDDYHHLQRLSAETEVGKTVTLDVIRRGARKSVKLKIAAAPDTAAREPSDSR